MKLYTEDEAYKAAGMAKLEPYEVFEVSQQMVQSHNKSVAFAIINRNFRELRAMLKQAENYARQRKALDAWRKSTGAVWDSHRQKFLVLGPLELAQK